MTAQPDAPREFGRPFVDLSDELEVADPDLVPDAGEESDLDVIERELKAAVAVPVTLPIEARPGWAATFRTDFDGRQLDAWRKQAKDRKMTDGIDGTKFAALLVASTMTGLTRQGEPVELAGPGKPTTATTRELQAMLGTNGALATVRHLYGGEGRVDATCRKIMTEAGWGEDVDTVDPQ